MTRVHVRSIVSLLLICAVLLAACGGGGAAPAPAPAAPAAQEPAAQGATEGGAAAPVAPPAAGEWRQIVRYNTMADFEAATGKTITEFRQAPMLDALVADGTLPPVEERLPDEPLILQPSDQIGEYGGTIVSPNLGGYDDLEDLLREFPHVYGSDMQGIWPNVFMDYEVNEDATSFIFKIRPGIKWSDGHPFGADDFVFWYEALAMNTELSPNGVNDLKSGGVMGKITKIDGHTIEMSFAAPYGILLERLNRWREVPYLPAHYLKQFHPSYTDPAEVDAIAKEKGFANWVELFQNESNWYINPDTPTIFAWRPVTRGVSVAVQEFERNPYYWKVDTEGNQLPYIDRVQVPLLPDQEAILLSVLSGETDYIYSYYLGFEANYPLLKQNEPDGKFRIVPAFGWSETLGVVAFNMSIDDPVLRDLFNNKDFRIALSIGYDRNQINQAIFNGLYIPSQPAPPDGSVYNGADPSFKQHIEHDPDRANEILDSLGLTWNSDRTQRLLPDGRPFELGALVHTSWIQQVPIAELIAQGWEDLGLKLVLQPQAGDFITERRLAGDYQLLIVPVNWGGQAPIIAAIRDQPVPISPSWLVNPPWAQWLLTNGSEGEEPPDAVKRLYEVHQAFVAEPDPQKRFELESEMYAIHNENLWLIGTVKQPADLAASWYNVVSSRMYNITYPVAPEWYYSVPATWAVRDE